MPTLVKEVTSKGDLKKFIQFPFSLYKGNPYWVPPLINDELKTFDPKQNPAFDYCKAKFWLAYQDDKIVGRVVGILHSKEVSDQQLARFGWIDFIDDHEVSTMLLETVETWAKSNGIIGLHGPMGFTDMDFEGLLIDGFDSISTIATIYNFPYYKDHLERLGYAKAVDWIEIEGEVPEVIPERLTRTANFVGSRFNLRPFKVKKSKDLFKYGKEMFETLNLSYQELYGFHVLTEREVDYYLEQYFSFIDKDFMSLIIDENDKVAGFGVTMPSLSLAMQKAKGRLFPFGFIHILRAMRKNDTAELFLIGIRPEYIKYGVSNMIFHEILQGYKKRGIKKIYTNHILANNRAALDMWKWRKDYSDEDLNIRKKRACFKKDI